jgi:hypothetical protein
MSDEMSEVDLANAGNEKAAKLIEKIKEKASEFTFTEGLPKEDDSGKILWNEYDLQNAKSVKGSMDSVHGFCGLMAGFQGFIINEYVKMDKHPEDNELSSIFKWGLFLLIVSFILNIASAILSFLWGVFLIEGHYRLWFMKVIGRLVKFMATIAVLSFCVGVLLFIDTIGLDKNMLITIYSGSAIILSIILSIFLYTMIMLANDTYDTFIQVMTSVNG